MIKSFVLNRTVPECSGVRLYPEEWSKKMRKGFTLVELIIVLALVCTIACFFLIIPLCRSNIWFSEVGVAEQLSQERRIKVEVIKVQRKFFSHSEVTVRVNEASEITVFCLDTDLFFNYEIVDCSR